MNTETKRHIDSARQVLVGVVPNPTSQIDQITNALIYKFMDDMDQAAIKVGGDPNFFVGDLEKYAWTRLMDSRMGNQERMNLYQEALLKFSESKQLPELFRGIFKSAFLPYRSPETLGMFLKEINYFDYSHPEELGNAYEYLLSIMSSQGDAGQFRTPRHIIDFIVEAVNPTKDDKVLDPACGTAGFLISAYKHILKQHDCVDDLDKKEKPLTPDQRKKLFSNFEGYDIDPGMVRIAEVNMYLHQFKNPKIFQYDSLSMEERWNDKFDVIMANPPFMSPKGGIKPHTKFSIQSSRSEVLFVDYIINHLRPKGRAGIIVPEGVIFQSGKAHKQIRKNLIEDGLYGVVSLPSGVFQPYSGVKTSILLFDNEVARQKNDILFIDVRDTGVSLGITQKIIEKNDLIPTLTIIKTFQNGGEVLPGKLAFTVTKKEIIDSDYDFSLSKYRKHIEVDKEKPFLPLSDICTINKGKSSSTKSKPGNYPLILTAEESKTSDHFDFEGEGVCVPLISSTGHGKADIKRIHHVKGKFALANLLAFIQPINVEIINSKYLFYCLDNVKDSLAKLMKGAANVSMKTSDLENFSIPVPSLQVQLEIVRDLERYGKIVDGANGAIANWKPVFKIDDSWETKKIEDIFNELKIGGTPPRSKQEYFEGDNIWVSIRDMVHGSVITNSKEKLTDDGIKKSNCKLVKKGSLLMSFKLSVGKVAFAGEDLYTNEAIVAFEETEKTKKMLDLKYLSYILPDATLSDHSINNMGARLLNKEKIRKLQIAVPPLDIQKKIINEVEREHSLIEANRSLATIYEDKIKKKIGEVWGE